MGILDIMHKSFDLYIEYLQKNKDRFPASVFNFATDIERHNLDSPHSLHDAWMESFAVKEKRQEERSLDASLAIELVLLGPMHDRDIILRYEGVVSYQIEGNKNPYNWSDTFHGDVSRHEVSISERGLICHEIEFASLSRIVIVCEHFSCVERLH